MATLEEHRLERIPLDVEIRLSLDTNHLSGAGSLSEQIQLHLAEVDPQQPAGFVVGLHLESSMPYQLDQWWPPAIMPVPGRFSAAVLRRLRVDALPQRLHRGRVQGGDVRMQLVVPDVGEQPIHRTEQRPCGTGRGWPEGILHHPLEVLPSVQSGIHLTSCMYLRMHIPWLPRPFPSTSMRTSA
jgi:hypothetical protein